MSSHTGVLKILRKPPVWLAVGALALAVVAAACTTAPETNVTFAQAQQTGVSVTGSGSVTVIPDVAVISIGIEAKAETVAGARAQAAGTMAAVQGSLQANGIEERDIRTTSFSIRPEYSRPREGTSKIIGYVVNNQLSVKVRELDDVSKVLDDATEAGGDDTRVNNISFTVDEPEQYFAEAREKAMKDALERAEQLAQSAGVTLGKPRTISESFGGFPVMRAFDAAFGGAVAEAAPPTPLSPGEQEISLTVQVTYDIE